MDEILIVEELVKHYPVRRGLVPRTVGYVHAVDGVSFSIGRGQTLGLVGESGCGKTTLGRAILRLVEPTSGRITFDGMNVLELRGRKLRKLRQRMQIVFQDPYGSLNPRMTVGQMIAEPILAHNLATRSAARERVAQLLSLVGLESDHARRYPHEFSGGQRQRIGIARALALRPDFVLCDEAVSSLDVSIQAQILNLLRNLQRRFSLTYLFIAHDLSVVKHVSDRIAVMYLGEIVEMADTETVFSNPLHPYTQALLASIPVPDPWASSRVAGIRGDIPSPSNPPFGCRFRTRCPLAINECAQATPPLTEIEPGHFVACIRAGESIRDHEYDVLN